MPNQGFDPENSIFDAEDSEPTEDVIGLASGDDAELDALRQELAEAKPLLEAFAQLEALAEAQSTTPEAIAIQASIDVLEVEQSQRRSEL